jgi:hypothetical protein
VILSIEACKLLILLIFVVWQCKSQTLILGFLSAAEFSFYSLEPTSSRPAVSYGKSFTTDFESAITSPPWAKEGGSNEPAIVGDPNKTGTNYVLKVQLPVPSIAYRSAEARSELRRDGGNFNRVPHWAQNGETYTYKRRIYVPVDHYCDPKEPMSIAQWHQSQGTGIARPPAMLRNENCEIKIVTRETE